jgi:hypothetical protein
MLFREIIPAYSESYIKTITTFCGQNAEEMNVQEAGRPTYSYHCALKD